MLNDSPQAISTHTLTWSVTQVGTAVRHHECHFNSHAHVERDHTELEKEFQQENFNSHAHVERDRLALTLKLENLNFNSHAHVERDAFNLSTASMSTISTHTLTWSVTHYVPNSTDGRNHFNSHAHVERDSLIR